MYRNKNTITLDLLLIDVDSCYSNKSWVPKLGLLWEDKEILLCDSSWLNDRHINAAQRLLKAANPNLPGFQNPLFGQTFCMILSPVSLSKYCMMEEAIG